MSVKYLLNRLELNFWNHIIPFMHESRSLRILLPKFYKLLEDESFSRYIIGVFVSATSGLVIGLVLGLLSALLR
jgi:hypothetical protein